MMTSLLSAQIQPTKMYELVIPHNYCQPIYCQQLDVASLDPTTLFSLPAQHTHLWIYSIASLVQLAKNHYAVLPTEIQRQADRMVSTYRRQTFECGQFLLRYLLGHYQDIPIADVAVSRTAHGKWVWAGQQPHITFNLSHSAEYLTIAFSRSHVLGVDIECHSSAIDLQALAKASCSACEWRYWQACPPAQQRDWFYTLWNIKEAYLKAIGTGAALPLSNYCLLNLLPIDGSCLCKSVNSQAISMTAIAGYSMALVAISNTDFDRRRETTANTILEKVTQP